MIPSRPGGALRNTPPFQNNFMQSPRRMGPHKQARPPLPLY
jgi:hypothetical protein